MGVMAKPRDPSPANLLADAEVTVGNIERALEAAERELRDTQDITATLTKRNQLVADLALAKDTVVLLRERVREADRSRRERDRVAAVQQARLMDAEWLAVAQELDELLGLVRAARAALENVIAKVGQARVSAGLPFPTAAKRAFFERAVLASIFGKTVISDAPGHGSRPLGSYRELAQVWAVRDTDDSSEVA